MDASPFVLDAAGASVADGASVAAERDEQPSGGLRLGVFGRWGVGVVEHAGTFPGSRDGCEVEG